MFRIVENKLQDGSSIFEVTGSVGIQSITVSALDEMHACEIAKALNEASAIAIDQPIDWEDFDARR